MIISTFSIYSIHQRFLFFQPNYLNCTNWNGCDERQSMMKCCVCFCVKQKQWKWLWGIALCVKTWKLTVIRVGYLLQIFGSKRQYVSLNARIICTIHSYVLCFSFGICIWCIPENETQTKQAQKHKYKRTHYKGVAIFRCAFSKSKQHHQPSFYLRISSRETLLLPC